MHMMIREIIQGRQ